MHDSVHVGIPWYGWRSQFHASNKAAKNNVLNWFQKSLKELLQKKLLNLTYATVVVYNCSCNECSDQI